jgi:hypothetical protein
LKASRRLLRIQPAALLKRSVVCPIPSGNRHAVCSLNPGIIDPASLSDAANEPGASR